MLETTIFFIGPHKICFWNLIFLLLIFLAATFLRRLVDKALKGYVLSAIHEGSAEWYFQNLSKVRL